MLLHKNSGSILAFRIKKAERSPKGIRRLHTNRKKEKITGQNMQKKTIKNSTVLIKDHKPQEKYGRDPRRL